MSIEAIRDYILTLPQVVESLPFGEDTLVFKVGAKMFAYLYLRVDTPYLCLKCDPEKAAFLREHYESVEEGYHMNKRHWIGLHLDRWELRVEQIYTLIRESYVLVWQGLSKKTKQALEQNQYKL